MEAVGRATPIIRFLYFPAEHFRKKSHAKCV